MPASPEYSINTPFRFPLRPTAAADQEKSMPTLEDQHPGCRTPTAEGFKLPLAPRSCPRAPRKPAQVTRCKRKLLPELEFVVVRQEEMESLFKKKKKVNGE